MSTTEYQADNFDEDMAELSALAATVIGAIDFLEWADRARILGNLAVVEALYELDPPEMPAA